MAAVRGFETMFSKNEAGIHYNSVVSKIANDFEIFVNKMIRKLPVISMVHYVVKLINVVAS